jgi:hypothetical protein
MCKDLATLSRARRCSCSDSSIQEGIQGGKNFDSIDTNSPESRNESSNVREVVKVSIEGVQLERQSRSVRLACLVHAVMWAMLALIDQKKLQDPQNGSSEEYEGSRNGTGPQGISGDVYRDAFIVRVFTSKDILPF